MKRFAITIRWRGYRWNLTGLARCSADLIPGIAADFGEGASIVVRPA